MSSPAAKSASIFPNYDLPSQSGLVLLLVVNALFFGSALLHLFGIGGALPLILNLVGALYLVLTKKRALGYPHLVLIGLILGSTLVQSVLWGNFSYLRYAAFPVSSILLLMLVSRADLDRMLNVVSVLMLVMLLLAALGFVAAFVGVEPLTTLENRDGRSLHIFFSTFSNSYNWNSNILRPSGIYDEPGALSFFVCSIACLRAFLGKSERFTWALLGLGLVTLSVAHVIYMLVHFLAVVRFRPYLNGFWVLIAVVIFGIFLSGLGSVFYDRLFLRFESTDDSKIVAGDNRSQRILGAIDIVASDRSVLLVGIGPDCVRNVRSCEHGDLPAFAAAPLEPLVLLGLTQGWLYYFVLAMLFMSPLFGRKYLVVFAFGLLLLQRPYVMHIGYSFYSFLVLFVFSGAVIDYFRREFRLKSQPPLALD